MHIYTSKLTLKSGQELGGCSGIPISFWGVEASSVGKSSNSLLELFGNNHKYSLSNIDNFELFNKMRLISTAEPLTRIGLSGDKLRMVT